MMGHSNCLIVAEIGVNHNGSVEIAKRLIDVAVNAGCDCVKFQKRTPAQHVRANDANTLRATPWGDMTALEYRERIEFWDDEYKEIDNYCKYRGIMWFASPWDVDSFRWLHERFDLPMYKVASACLTNEDLLEEMSGCGRKILVSTGMSDLSEIAKAVAVLKNADTVLLHCTSSYPTIDGDIDLPVIHELREEFGLPVGYSGHEVGLLPSVLAVALYSACVVERHITLDRGIAGSDHGASLEPLGLTKLVRDIRRAERLKVGRDHKTIHNSELANIARLRHSEK